MTTMYINTNDAKDEFSDLIHRVSHNKQRIILTRRDREVAALVPIEDLQFLQQAESKNDLDQAVDALKEARSYGTVTLDELKKEIG